MCPNEITWKDDLVRAAALYAAAIPLYPTEEKTSDIEEYRGGKTNNNIL